VAHALVRTVSGFSIARFALGLAKPATSRRHQNRRRMVPQARARPRHRNLQRRHQRRRNRRAPGRPLDHIKWGWHWAFLITGGAGLLWLAFWLPMYHHPRQHKRVAPQEVAWIERDPPEPSCASNGATSSATPGLGLRTRQIHDRPIWWFYLYWTGLFLDARFNIKLSQLSLPLIIITWWPILAASAAAGSPRAS